MALPQISTEVSQQRGKIGFFLTCMATESKTPEDVTGPLPLRVLKYKATLLVFWLDS